MSDELFDKLGKGFTRFGKRLRGSASELVKAAGIGVGRVELHLEQHAFRPGDEVTGKLVLALEEPTDARRVVVSLIGTRQRVSYDRDRSGRTRQTRHDETVCEIERELAGPGRYRDEAFSFALAIPRDACAPAAGATGGDGGLLGDLARAVSAVAGARTLPTSWRVIAAVDIPRRRDVKAKADITIRE